MKKAFTLIEILIVVTILGILAAVVIPCVQGGSAASRDAAAKSSIQTLRSQIELYKIHHNDQAPGLIDGVETTADDTIEQFTNYTQVGGRMSPSGKNIGDYVLGPYILEMAVNVYNDLGTITIVADGTDFSAAANDASGWLYKIGSAEIRINSTGTSDDGTNHYDF